MLIQQQNSFWSVFFNDACNKPKYINQNVNSMRRIMSLLAANYTPGQTLINITITASYRGPRGPLINTIGEYHPILAIMLSVKHLRLRLTPAPTP